MLSRRSLLLGLAAPGKPLIRLHIGNYGMQSLGVEEALELIRTIGYDGAELCCMAGWPSEPKLLGKDVRRRIRDSKFPIPTLIENLGLVGDEAGHQANLRRILTASELAHDLAPGNPPILQTVLGGRPADWPAIRPGMVARLHDWGKAAEQAKVRLAVKAHASQAVDTPEKLIGLLDEVKHPALTAIYDYGHFQHRGLTIDDTMRALLPRSAFLTVKDSKVVDGKPQFLLPGDGTIDYKHYFETVKKMKWSGWVLVEITRQLQVLPGYSGKQAAARSYAHLAPILRAAGLRA